MRDARSHFLNFDSRNSSPATFYPHHRSSAGRIWTVDLYFDADLNSNRHIVADPISIADLGFLLIIKTTTSNFDFFLNPYIDRSISF